jgi:methyltransferase-like protein
MSEEQPLEIEVRKWDAHSFTIEGVNDQLEKLLKEQKIIRTLALRDNGKMVRISRDVRLKSRKDFYFTPTVETTTIENTLNQGTTFEYEGLDWLATTSKNIAILVG